MRGDVDHLARASANFTRVDSLAGLDDGKFRDSQGLDKYTRMARG